MSSSDTSPANDLCALGVAELGHHYRKRNLSPVEVTRAILGRIERLNPMLNAYITLMPESALAAAKAAELQLMAGIDLGPMHGVPVSVKDIMSVKGTLTTAASRVLLDAHLDEEDALVVRRLRSAGAVILGKTNLHEFAHGDPDPESPFGDVQNPRKLGHSCGSSSSGSAAAVTAGLGAVSLGTDTGGSVRYPASMCGVVGLRPSHGLVPNRGVIPLSVHQDCVGPIARSVADAAAALATIAGHDPADDHSALVPLSDYTSATGKDVKGLRLGLPTNSFYRFGQPQALALFDSAVAVLASLGLAQIPIEVPLADEINEISTLISEGDLWTYHERYRGREALYGRSFMERARKGLESTAAEYARALRSQVEMRRGWLALFERVDILALPANSAGAPRHGEDVVIEGRSYPIRMACNRFSRGPSLVGFPSLSLPVGATDEGLPIGIQLVGSPFAEARLLAVGHALEVALGSFTRKWGIEPRT